MTKTYRHVEAWVLAKAYRTWIGHGLAGLVCGLVGGLYGAGAVAGYYTYKEYTDWRGHTSVWYDYLMDWVSPLVGGLVGYFVRSLL